MTPELSFFPLIALLSLHSALADKALCPKPSDANQLVYKQDVHESAPDFGRTEKEYSIPKPERDIACITLSGTATGSIASIGFSDRDIKVKLVSGIKEGFDAELEVYSK